jgi:hypothetical protein
MKEHTLIWSAIHELKIDVPIMRYEIKGDTITLYLYGGQVVTYSPKDVGQTVSLSVAQPAPKPASPALAGKGPGGKPKAKPIGGTPLGGTPLRGTPQ